MVTFQWLFKCNKVSVEENKYLPDSKQVLPFYLSHQELAYNDDAIKQLRQKCHMLLAVDELNNQNCSFQCFKHFEEYLGRCMQFQEA